MKAKSSFNANQGNEKGYFRPDRWQLFLRMSDALGVRLTHESRILDFGCGDGKNTLALRRAGFKAYGFDVEDSYAPYAKAQAACEDLTSERVFASGPISPYRLPYPDGTFDLIFSDHVMEHVVDYNATLYEMRRVLRDSGIALHIFPSRYRIAESHLRVPFGGAVASPAWFSLWDRMGVLRNIFRETDGCSNESLACRSADWVRTRCNYLSKAELRNQFGHHFKNVRFAECTALKSEYGISNSVIGTLISTFHVRVVALS